MFLSEFVEKFLVMSCDTLVNLFEFAVYKGLNRLLKRYFFNFFYTLINSRLLYLSKVEFGSLFSKAFVTLPLRRTEPIAIIIAPTVNPPIGKA